MLMDAANLQKSSEMSALALQASLDEAKSVANKAMESSNSDNESERVSLDGFSEILKGWLGMYTLVAHILSV